MIAQRGYAVWAGWGGTVLFLVSWLAIARISVLSFPLWIGLMLSGAILCFYGGARRSKWFLVPGFAAVVVTAGVLAGVYLAG